MPPSRAGVGILRWLSWDEIQPSRRCDEFIRLRQRLIEALIRGIEETLKVRLRPDRLRVDELEAAIHGIGYTAVAIEAGLAGLRDDPFVQRPGPRFPRIASRKKSAS